MPPDDRTPHGGEIMHAPPDRAKIPDLEPLGDNDEHGTGTDAGEAPDVAARPALPDHPEQMAADIEDEEADPVIDTGPGIADGFKSLKKQKG